MQKSIAFCNGAFLPIEEASISIMDRGFYFGDGVYDVVMAFNHIPFALDDHLDRFAYSARELEIDCPYDRDVLARLIQEGISQVEGDELIVYFQLTRGAAPRRHAFPPSGTPPTFMMTVRPHRFGERDCVQGLRSKLFDDIRWGRCDIKTLNLIPNTFFMQKALEQGYDDALFAREGLVTECAASTMYIVKDGVLRTHPLTHAILPGTTRKHILQLASQLALSVEERAFTTEELFSADEAFCSDVTHRPAPVVSVDDRPIADGRPGPVTRALQRAYHARVVAACGPTYFDASLSESKGV